MIERQTGKIILMNTDAGRWPTPGECLPGSGGAALVMATKVLAAELAPHNIRINTVCATLIRDTPAVEQALSGPTGPVFRKIMERQPFPTTTNDIAEAFLFFASDESNAITGQILSVNGG